MTNTRFKGKAKEKRDSWVRQMAIDMPQLSQKEIAQRFGLEQSTVSRILKVEPKVLKKIGGGEDFPIYQGKGREIKGETLLSNQSNGYNLVTGGEQWI